MASDGGSVSQWIADIKEGDSLAASDLWHQYFEKLVVIARKRLHDRHRRVADEEDVVLSVFDTLYRGARDGRFEHVQNRNDLWRLLIVIVRRKVINRHRKATAQKRGGPQLDHTSNQPVDELIGTTPTPDDLACLAEEFENLMNCLDQNMLREIAQFKLEGYLNREIAEELNISIRTVQRKLNLIGATWMNAVV